MKKSSIATAGLLTRRAASCEMTADRIRYHLKTLTTRGLPANDRLSLWRSIIRLAQDEYDRELSELESLNSVKADPALEVPIVL